MACLSARRILKCSQSVLGTQIQMSQEWLSILRAADQDHPSPHTVQMLIMDVSMCVWTGSNAQQSRCSSLRGYATPSRQTGCKRSPLGAILFSCMQLRGSSIGIDLFKIKTVAREYVLPPLVFPWSLLMIPSLQHCLLSELQRILPDWLTARRLWASCPQAECSRQNGIVLGLMILCQKRPCQWRWTCYSACQKVPIEAEGWLLLQ